MKTLLDSFAQMIESLSFGNILGQCRALQTPDASGCLSVMLGSALWQLLASFLAWPVSGSHSIVSGLLGFTLVAKGI